MEKIIQGTVTINGKLYKAFEMYHKGPWKIIQGTRHGDPEIACNIQANSARQALIKWMKQSSSNL